MSGTATTSLLGSNSAKSNLFSTGIPTKLPMKISTELPKAVLGLREALYVQMSILSFVEGTEDRTTVLLGYFGPVTSVKRAKKFQTMRAAQAEANRQLTQSSDEYRVISVAVVTESDIAKHLSEVSA
jgi:hypothetical protein